MPPIDENNSNVERSPQQVNPNTLKSNVMAKPRTERAKKPLLLVLALLLVIVIVLVAWFSGLKPLDIIKLPTP